MLAHLRDRTAHWIAFSLLPLTLAAGGCATTPQRPISDWHDAADSVNLTAELVRRGHGRAEIEALWGGNFLRLLRVAEEAADA